MDVRVLGPLEVRQEGRDVTPTSPNQRILLAVLASHPDQYVRTDTLVDALWGDDPPPTVRPPGSFFQSATMSSIELYGESAGTATPSDSSISRAIGVASVSLYFVLFV